MSVFILLGKKYDTDKMEFISKVKKHYKHIVWSAIFNEDRYLEYTCKLYRSKNNNFLLTREDSACIYGEAITEYEAKRLLMRFNYKKYEELFGEIEEA